jgi:hypothetical protein
VEAGILIEVQMDPEFTPQSQSALLLETLVQLGELRGSGSCCAACWLALSFRDGDDELGVLADAAQAHMWAERAKALGHPVPEPGADNHEAAHGAVLDPEYEVFEPLASAAGGGGGGRGGGGGGGSRS